MQSRKEFNNIISNDLRKTNNMFIRSDHHEIENDGEAQKREAVESPAVKCEGQHEKKNFKRALVLKPIDKVVS